MKKGKIWIVGAGPGAADLLTIKALRSIQNADVILYDALLSDEVRELFPKKTIAIDVGKRSGDGKNPIARQDNIHEQLLAYSLLGYQVVRLKCGDPMVYGRGAEEVSYLLQSGLDFEMIPGISAGIAAASEFLIPLTERGKSSAIHFHSAIKLGGKKSGLNNIIREIENDDTVVIYMGLEQLKPIAKELNSKLSKETNINVLSKISYPNAKQLSGNTQFFSKIKDDELPESPALIVLGNHSTSLNQQVTFNKKKKPVSQKIKQLFQKSYLNIW